MTTSKIPTAATEFAMPKGFRFGVAEGAIKKPGRPDVAVVLPCAPAAGLAASAVFTRNRFAAAPVKVSRGVLINTGGRVAAAVVNSGCANAVTGAEGHKNAVAMAKRITGVENSLVCSTGTIGVQLPMERLLPAIDLAASSAGSDCADFVRFAQAIMTTDTRMKTAAFQCASGVSVIGCAKGSGMIAPDMATLLAYVCTDASISPEHLQALLAGTVDETVNCLTVDGDTSTNDTLIALASGITGPAVLPDTPEWMELRLGFLEVMRSLTIQLAADGEGATTVIEIVVEGAATPREARAAASEVANSPLVKTAVNGRDANWGRIAMALGNSGADFDPENVAIHVGPLPLLVRGVPQPFDEATALEVLNTDYLVIRCQLGAGLSTARMWTCDLSKEYIEINGAYRT